MPLTEVTVVFAHRWSLIASSDSCEHWSREPSVCSDEHSLRRGSCVVRGGPRQALFLVRAHADCSQAGGEDEGLSLTVFLGFHRLQSALLTCDYDALLEWLYCRLRNQESIAEIQVFTGSQSSLCFQEQRNFSSPDLEGSHLK